MCNFREIAAGAEMLPQRRLGEHAHHEARQADPGKQTAESKQIGELKEWKMHFVITGK